MGHEAHPATPPSTLDAVGLSVVAPSGATIVEDVSLRLGRGEAVAIVGESGSGKTTLALALMGAARNGAKVVSGTVTLGGELYDATRDELLRPLRGSRISYVPQIPGTALNPAERVGGAIRRMYVSHTGDERGAAAATTSLLESVGLPSDPEFQRRYPHQISGGQQQRVCIAVALAASPTVVVLDEPTTSLDVVTQARVLETLKTLRSERGIAFVYVTHDMAVAATIADSVAVMYAGRVVEHGPVSEVLRVPRHPYTAALIDSIPDHEDPGSLVAIPGVAVGIDARPPGCAYAPRCPRMIEACEVTMPEIVSVNDATDVRCVRPLEVGTSSSGRVRHDRTAGLAAGGTVLRVEGLGVEHATRTGPLRVANEISFSLDAGACVALVGESGSGKTTIARSIAGLHAPCEGSVLLGDVPLAGLAKHRTVEQRRRVQLIFQSAAEALNPRHTVLENVGRPARALRGLSREAARGEVLSILDRVRLPARFAGRYPNELSGGERQRVGIARALAAGPEILICDEITSALDVSVQAAVLDLLSELRADLGISLLFIAHDLGVVASVADYVLVLRYGDVCEQGSVDEVIRDPKNDYTQRLIGAAPSISRSRAAWA